mgnify:CR=1 FL=1
MIDDATLAEWEKKAHQNWMGTVTEHLLAAIKEIRRLREVERAVWNQGLEADGQTRATLTLENQRLKARIAAYRAVVRELAEAIEMLTEKSPNGLRIIHGGVDHSVDSFSCRVCLALAHPLVVVARRETL